MERYASLDKSRLLNFKIRIGETSVPKVLTFVNSDGTPYDISGKGWKLPVKKTPSATTNLFELSEGSGLTVQGSGSNQLKIEVTAEQASINKKQANVYFGTLFSEEEDHTWLNGDWEFHNGKYDGVTETDTITISEDGEDITITISQEGISQAELDAAIEAALALTIFTEDTLSSLIPHASYDAYELTAQAEALTIANPSVDYANFDGFIVRITDNGTARALTFGNKYRSQGEALPTTTTLGKVMIITCLRDSNTDKYDTRFTEEV
jgi:hypothetical protein